jgi:hypothetical protein
MAFAASRPRVRQPVVKTLPQGNQLAALIVAARRGLRELPGRESGNGGRTTEFSSAA